MIGTFDVLVLDCADTRALARFYAELLGGEVVAFDEDWAEVVLPIEGSRPLLAFQQVEHYRAPEWPAQDVPQQMHIDVKVDDLDVGEAAVLAIGATVTGKAKDDAGIESFRVYLDPAGHPFCLIQPGD
ncbi:VOC family protein [Curtobacterium sp. VKM Ac-2865]|uniref:VOC family protein n=1 Tax=Curtobacterium sp. VKM Ac-2865 TaxID=2783817 RepID=UPI00188CA261|nr:VOC family protein [Curtobacterium sp. VKM Ac-2865]MBF4583339.1 VOC family protein [Curtobacterium sp. VKM Ac-2865]